LHANFITSSYIEAAEDLGASPWQQFFKVGKRRKKKGKGGKKGGFYRGK